MEGARQGGAGGRDACEERERVSLRASADKDEGGGETVCEEKK